MSEIIKFTRPDNIIVYVVKSSIVSWSIDKNGASSGTKIVLGGGFQYVKEPPEKVAALFEAAK